MLAQPDAAEKRRLGLPSGNTFVLYHKHGVVGYVNDYVSETSAGHTMHYSCYYAQVVNATMQRRLRELYTAYQTTEPADPIAIYTFLVHRNIRPRATVFDIRLANVDVDMDCKNQFYLFGIDTCCMGATELDVSPRESVGSYYIRKPNDAIAIVMAKRLIRALTLPGMGLLRKGRTVN